MKQKKYTSLMSTLYRIRFLVLTMKPNTKWKNKKVFRLRKLLHDTTEEEFSNQQTIPDVAHKF